MTAGARVSRLSTTPVKGLALHHRDEILLLRTGAAGDREFFVIDGRDRLTTGWKTGRPGSDAFMRSPYPTTAQMHRWKQNEMHCLT